MWHLFLAGEVRSRRLCEICFSQEKLDLEDYGIFCMFSQAKCNQITKIVSQYWTNKNVLLKKTYHYSNEEFRWNIKHASLVGPPHNQAGIPDDDLWDKSVSDIIGFRFQIKFQLFWPISVYSI